MEKMLSRKTTLLLFIVPGLLVFSLVYIFPMFYTLRLGVTDWKGIGEMNYVGFTNYVKLFTRDRVFKTSLKNVLVVVCAGVPVQLFGALVIALAMHYLKTGLRFFRNAFFIPVLMSASAIGIMWCEFYDVSYGAVNGLLHSIGLDSWCREWLTVPNTVLPEVIIPAVWQWLGYHLIIMYSGMCAIPEQYEEAARIDGCSTIQSIWHITLPLMRDVLKVCVVLAVVGSLKFFDIPYVMTGGGPYNLTSTIALQMYKEAFLKLQFGYGSSIAVVLCVICIGMFVLINRLLTREAVTY